MTMSAGLPQDPRSPGRARALARDALAAWDLPDLTESLELAVSELVTNAVRHGSGPITVQLRRLADCLRLEVHDAGTGRPNPRQAAEGDTGGRGLLLVSTLGRAWGCLPDGDGPGKTVWVEFPTG